MSLSMRAITKSFSSNAVLKGVDFALEDGEIRALIGENGAGKTTLMNILGGVLRPDAGVIELDGKRVEFASPRDSLAAGIAFIHQELNLVNDLNVYENLFLGRERVRGAFTDTARMREEARAVLERMGMALDPCAMVRDLDASYKQVVEIARALLFDARVIIMDEPTTSLTEPEIERVFSMMRTVKEQGVSIVFISHKLREVLEICDTYTVLRDGVNVAAGATRETTEAELARHMVGHEVSTARVKWRWKWKVCRRRARLRTFRSRCARARFWGSPACWATGAANCSKPCSAIASATRAACGCLAGKWRWGIPRRRGAQASAMCRATARKTAFSRT